MPELEIGSNVALHYHDDDFTDSRRSPDTVLLQHGFSRNGGFWYGWVSLLAHEFLASRAL